MEGGRRKGGKKEREEGKKRKEGSKENIYV